MDTESFILFLVLLIGIMLLGMFLVVSGFNDKLITLVSGVCSISYSLAQIVVKLN